MRCVNKTRIHENTINHNALHESHVVVQVYVVRLGVTPCVVVWLVMVGKLLFLCMLALVSAQGFALNGKIDEEIIVTGIAPKLMVEAPRSVSVITAEEVAKSGVQTVPELLAREANITLTSFTGNAKFSRIDVRGSGDTSVSNVLTLIDGIKINTPDLAGTDFSIIPLDQIERIEVIRGANTVRYGAGASHGVVNIITKRLEAGPDLTLKYQRGSFNTESANAYTSAGTDHQAISVSRHYADSDGYREHNLLKTESTIVRYQAQYAEKLVLNVKSQFYKDEYQLPGPLDKKEVELGIVDRRKGSVIDGAEGKTNDRTHMFQLEARPSAELTLTVTQVFRQRENDFVFNNTLEEGLVRTIDLDTKPTEFIMHYEPMNEYGHFTAGYEIIKSDYSRGPVDRKSAIGLKTKSAYLEGHASFAQLLLKTHQQHRFSVGYRKSDVHSQFLDKTIEFDEDSSLCDIVFDPVAPMVPIPINCPIKESLFDERKNHWVNEAYEYNAVFALPLNMKTYLSYAQTFRVPVIDEIALSPDDLRSQSAERFEAGLKYLAPHYRVELAGFKSITDDEIIFRRAGSDDTGENFNFPSPIRRSGIEVVFSADVTDSISVDLNAGYVKARITNNKILPLVAEKTAYAGLRWQMTQNMSAYVDVNYQSERFGGNDEGNTKTPLASQFISNARLSYKLADNIDKVGWEFYLAINNAFDREYFTASYTNAAYPASGRSFIGGIKVVL